MTYTFSGTAVADAVAAPPPLTVGPLPKFGPGALPTGIQFTPLRFSSIGPRGSTADANMVGSSDVGVFFYGCDVAVSATAGAAPGGTASATASALDPWELTIPHRPGRKSYVLVSVAPNFSLAPARGVSSMRLFGSFGEIALSLNGTNSKPAATINLAPGWRVYDDVQLPSVGVHFKAPKHRLTPNNLKKLFLRQHKKNVPVWFWGRPVPTLTFVHEVPPSVSTMQVEIGLGVSDDDAHDTGRDRERRRR